MARPRNDTPAPKKPAPIHRTTVSLAPGDKRALAETARNVTAAVRELIRDGLTLYGLPAPIRETLQEDMRALRMQRPRDYIVYLLFQRHASLGERKAEAPRSQVAA